MSVLELAGCKNARVARRLHGFHVPRVSSLLYWEELTLGLRRIGCLLGSSDTPFPSPFHFFGQRNARLLVGLLSAVSSLLPNIVLFLCACVKRQLFFFFLTVVSFVTGTLAGY